MGPALLPSLIDWLNSGRIYLIRWDQEPKFGVWPPGGNICLLISWYFSFFYILIIYVFYIGVYIDKCIRAGDQAWVSFFISSRSSLRNYWASVKWLIRLMFKKHWVLQYMRIRCRIKLLLHEISLVTLPIKILRFLGMRNLSHFLYICEGDGRIWNTAFVGA